MATIDSRYSFTTQFLIGAKILADRARIIERSTEDPQGDVRAEHLAYVVGAIMQSVAALEAEVAEVLIRGPGYHLGSNAVDIDARDFLQPLADLVDDEPVTDRYMTLLHLLRKDSMERGAEPFQSANLLVGLRNEVVHYKAKSGRDMDRQKLFQSLKQRRLPKPPFVQGNVNFFPQECLGAACAEWAWRSAVGFLDTFYRKLGAPNPLDAYRTVLM